MKVLIASVTAGHGHHAAASATADFLVHRGHEVVTIDLLKEIDRALYLTIDKGHLLGTMLTPRQYGWMYKRLEESTILRRSLAELLTVDSLTKKAYKKLHTLSPDVIVSTHPVAARIIDELLTEGKLSALHVGINTDFTILPTWEDVAGIDYLVTCGPMLESRAVSRGIPSGRLLPFGIPVHERFNKSVDKNEARESLGMEMDKPSALVMSGSMGFGGIENVVSETAANVKELQMTVVCGNNKRLLRRLSQMNLPERVRLTGFADNVDVLMDACDIIITKPGGLSVSEALAKRKPIVLINPIPGNEDENAEYLTNLGMAMQASGTMPVWELVTMLVKHPKRVEMIRQSIDIFAERDSARRLVDFLEMKIGADRQI